MIRERDILNAVLREDFSSFIAKTFATVDGSQRFLPNWHIDLMAHHLEMASRRETKRLLITLPPRNLKSICASVAFPAWLLGKDPGARIICASYSGDLAGKHARDSRAVMETEWYRRAFPKTRLNRKKSAEADFETTAKGYRFSTSVGGTLTGRGGNFVIIDDPIKPGDALSETKRASVKQWFDGTLYSRLDDKRNDVIILIMQRVHTDDLVAHVLEKEDWTHLNLPAIAETREYHDLGEGTSFVREPGDVLHREREPLHVLEQVKASLGTFYFNAQYQQTPAPECGNLIKWEWFRTYEDLPPERAANDEVVQSWDTAMTAHDGSDWSACSTWAIRGEDYYLIDMYRDRLDFPTLKRKIESLRREFSATSVLIEDKGSGTGLIQQLRCEDKVRPISIQPSGSKADRIAAQSTQIEAGRVFLPQKAAWLDEFRLEMLAFPHGKHDDQVDSVSQFLTWIVYRESRRLRVVRVLGV